MATGLGQAFAVLSTNPNATRETVHHHRLSTQGIGWQRARLASMHLLDHVQ